MAAFLFTRQVLMPCYLMLTENGEKNRELFAGLDIEKVEEKYMVEQGSRLVVFLTLKGAQSREFEGMMDSFICIVCRL